MNGNHNLPFLRKFRQGLLKLWQLSPFKLLQRKSDINIDRPSRRGEINLGDLAKALSTLKGVSAAEQEMIANCLGFQLQTPVEPITPNKPFHPVQAAWNRPLLKEHFKSAAQKRLDYTPKPAMPPAPEPPPAVGGDVLSTDMTIEEAPQNDATLQEENIRKANPLILTRTSSPAPRKTLFSNQTARGIISAAVMRQVPGQDLDIPQLIQATVRRQNLKKLPVLPRFTARNGCQLMLDFNEALMPWWDDMQSLILQFHQLLGEEPCPVYEFENVPSDAVRWTENGDILWQPVTGKPVIIASDLGVIQPTRSVPRAGKAVWFEFVNTCRRRNIPVIVLSPLLPQRSPKGLDRMISLIHWNPATTATIIKRLIAHSGSIT